MGAFASFGDFIAMGGHGLYVWLAYGFFAVVMVWLMVTPILDRKKLVKEQVMKMRRENP